MDVMVTMVVAHAHTINMYMWPILLTATPVDIYQVNMLVLGMLQCQQVLNWQ